MQLARVRLGWLRPYARGVVMVAVNGEDGYCHIDVWVLIIDMVKEPM